ncbi:MAG: multicopper oxidase domain-containing protein [Actinomycetota bacterium]
MGGDHRHIVAIAIACVVVTIGATLAACTPHGPPEESVRTDSFSEPVRLSSDDGVLEVTLTAHQDTIALDTVDRPVTNALVFAYELQQGSASNGERSAASNYPAPTLHVAPGETLIVHLANDLKGLSIRDFYDPAFTPKGTQVPLYPQQLTEAPFNLHTHGLHVSPSGNSDNVLLDIPPGYTNTYTYRIPGDMPQGLYWYHGHRHTLTAQETYLGLAGLLEIGEPSGDIPLVKQHDLPVRTMALQYNYVFDRAGGSAQLNDANWPQYVSTRTQPQDGQLADGTYEPLLTPVNFGETARGTQSITNWYAGKLSVHNDRGRFQFLPSNELAFTPEPGATGVAAVPVEAEPELPADRRDVQFTVNGDFQPRIAAAPGQTEIWVLANVSDFAYINVTLTETATGEHPPIAVVGQDGNPYPAVHVPDTPGGAQLLIPPGSRYAIAVTMPDHGDLVLEMPPMRKGMGAHGPGISYVNDGTGHPPAAVGTIDVPREAISYVDGFFLFPTQELVRMTPAPGRETPVAFAEGQVLDAYTSFYDTRGIEPDVRRRLVISGGFDDEYASIQDPKAFTYQFDGNIFPYMPLLQPRVGSVEQWTIVNRNNDQHPIHIHVNDFQVTDLVDPVAGTHVRFQPWGQDNANTPAPRMDAAGNILAPGILSVRTHFDRYTGTYVMHCHRLNHEDNGLMAIVNVIPARSTYAVATSGTGTDPGPVIEVRDQAGPVAEVTPFQGATGAPSLAMGDVDGDNVLDLLAGSPDDAQVVAYAGAGERPFTRELARFDAFDDAQTGGISVAAADIDGNSLADNIIVGNGPGTPSQVRVFASTLPEPGGAPALFSSFSPNGSDAHGTDVTAGLVDLATGRNGIVTVPGPGTAGVVKVFTFSLFTENGAPTAGPQAPPEQTAAAFEPFPGYTGGLSLATGWVAGELGGAERIVVGQAAAPGRVRVFSSGSAMDGHPTMYLDSPDAMEPATFQEMASLAPGGAGRTSGVQVATASTTTGADLLVTTPGPEDDTVRYTLQRTADGSRLRWESTI